MGRGGFKQAREQLVRKQAAVVESQALLEDSLRLLCAHLLPPPRSPGVPVQPSGGKQGCPLVVKGHKIPKSRGICPASNRPSEGLTSGREKLCSPTRGPFKLHSFSDLQITL